MTVSTSRNFGGTFDRLPAGLDQSVQLTAGRPFPACNRGMSLSGGAIFTRTV
jgi:hypothetical protein